MIVKTKSDKEVRRVVVGLEPLLDLVPEASDILAQVNKFLGASDKELADNQFGMDVVARLQKLRNVQQRMKSVFVSPNQLSPPNPPPTYTGGVDEDGLESISEYGTLGLGPWSPSQRIVREQVNRLVAELLFVIAPCLSFYLNKQLECFKENSTFMGITVRCSTSDTDEGQLDDDECGEASSHSCARPMDCILDEPAARPWGAKLDEGDAKGLLCRICENVFIREDMPAHTNSCVARMLARKSQVSCEKICAELHSNLVTSTTSSEEVRPGSFETKHGGASSLQLQRALGKALRAFDKNCSFVVCEKSAAPLLSQQKNALRAEALVPVFASQGFYKLVGHSELDVLSNDVLVMLSGDKTNEHATKRLRQVAMTSQPSASSSAPVSFAPN